MSIVSDVAPACEAGLEDAETQETSVSDALDEYAEARDALDSMKSGGSFDVESVCSLIAQVSRLRGQPQDTLSVLKHLSTELVEAADAVGTDRFAEELTDLIFCAFTAVHNEKINLPAMIMDVLEKNLSRAEPVSL